MSKVVVVPLATSHADDIARWMSGNIPGWGTVLVQAWARYLGYALGPGRGDRSWSKQLAKAKDRCKEWACQSLGIQLSAFVCKV